MYRRPTYVRLVSPSPILQVKLWDHNVASALKSFDLFMAVGDISWAPYSSTVFSAVANDVRIACHISYSLTCHCSPLHCI